MASMMIVNDISCHLREKGEASVCVCVNENVLYAYCTVVSCGYRTANILLPYFPARFGH